MANEPRSQSGFISYLTSLTPVSDRGTLAELSRGMRFPPGEDVGMYRHIACFIPDSQRGSWQEKVYYLVASLYAYHKLDTKGSQNFGQHMAAAARTMSDTASTEKRFILLLGATSEELPEYLRHAVRFLKSKEVPVNWNNLFEDLRYWNHPNRFIQRRWANGFWGYIAPAAAPDSSVSTIEQPEED